MVFDLLGTLRGIRIIHWEHERCRAFWPCNSESPVEQKRENKGFEQHDGSIQSCLYDIRLDKKVHNAKDVFQDMGRK